MCCCDCAKKIVIFCETRCSDRAMIILNLVACAMILICTAFRFVYVAQGNYDGTDQSRIGFFIILSIYLFIFTVFQILAELKNVRVRLYMNFLDGKFGRGLFFIFLGLLIISSTSALEIVLSLCVLAIGSLNMLIGWTQGSDGKDAIIVWDNRRKQKNKKRDEQPAAPSSSSPARANQRQSVVSRQQPKAEQYSNHIQQEFEM